MQEQIFDALRRGDTAAALDMARAFAAGTPDDAGAQRLLALALRGSGDPAGAREAIERAIALAPDDARLHLEHARLLLGTRDLEAAAQVLDTTIGIDPNQFGAYVLQAELAMGRNDLEEAERLARLAARVSPDHPTLQSLEGTIALRRGNADEALKLLSAAAERAPEDAVTLHALAFAYLAKGHFAFAEQTLRKLVGRLPAAKTVRLMIAQLQFRQGRPGDAADEVAALLQDAPGSPPEVRRLAGELELVAGRPERALPVLREALAGLPGEPRTMTAITEAWRRLGAFDDARETLDAALDATPDNDGLWRARLAFAQDGPGSADVVARWRNARPDSIEALETAMLLHASAGRAAEAEAAARELLERAPGHLDAELRVADALLGRDPAEAVRYLEELQSRLARPEEQRLVTAWLGLARHRAGDFAGALEAWTRHGAEEIQGRLPLPPATPAPAQWPEPAAAAPDAPPAAFLVGLPGSLVERAAAILEPVLPTFRADRFSARPPADLFQDLDAWPRIAAGEITADRVVGSWRGALASRAIGGAIVDWLPWWDNVYAAVMRAALPEARLLLVLRDPRDMLLDWLAFGSPTPFLARSPQDAADWLAAALGQLASLHEQDLVPHHLLKVDDSGEDAKAMSVQIGEALGITLPKPPAGYFGAPRFAAGTWRSYADLLAEPFAALGPVARRFGYPDA